jgi:hypothetical protein
MRTVLVSALCLLTLACAGSRANPAALEASFDAAEYRPYAASGTASIGGQAYLRLEDGRAIFAAGDEIRLIPSTPYTREFVEKKVVGAQIVDNIDARLDSVTRRAWGDGTGFFDFRDLPAGEYILLCEIDWEEPGPYGSTSSKHTVYRAVSLADGERIPLVVLSR